MCDSIAVLCSKAFTDQSTEKNHTSLLLITQYLMSATFDLDVIICKGMHNTTNIPVGLGPNPIPQLNRLGTLKPLEILKITPPPPFVIHHNDLFRDIKNR